uniref:Uncharacterized protein n=1 Tax=Denticeps clupeoides TaxID=299321 RepID=A0AAY4E7V3_9TELE
MYHVIIVKASVPPWACFTGSTEKSPAEVPMCVGLVKRVCTHPIIILASVLIELVQCHLGVESVSVSLRKSSISDKCTFQQKHIKRFLPWTPQPDECSCPGH